MCALNAIEGISMKKAFDQNVSRAKPRVRLGGAAEDPAGQASIEDVPAQSASDALSSEIKARLDRARSAEAQRVASAQNGIVEVEDRAQVREEPAPKAAAVEEPAPKPKRTESAKRNGNGNANGAEPTAESRREKLKERLRAARENPRPEPLPATVAEAGALAVERISSLQTEVSRLKALNLNLTQDLESSRRHSEKATEEARIRMDEARRLSSEMDARAKLLAELERELASLEGERNEALLALQDSRQVIESANHERESFLQEISTRDRALADSLAEEERLAGELEAARDHSDNLRRSLDALNSERDVLARQVADLTTERAELLEARKALESVHRALTSATLR
jgi:chromosome segregation ATPase